MANGLRGDTLLARQRERPNWSVADGGAAGGNVRDRVDIRSARIERHVEADVAVVALFNSGEISGVLGALDP
jgi:hypothetical protein